MSNRDLADAVPTTLRTVGNWRSETTPRMPNDKDRATLRRILGPYDTPGDPVETAIRASELTEDRQDTAVGFYKRLLREQRAEKSA